jgi:uncharacterized ferredoxin-like protein
MSRYSVISFLSRDFSLTDIVLNAQAANATAVVLINADGSPYFDMNCEGAGSDGSDRTANTKHTHTRFQSTCCTALQIAISLLLFP